MQSFMKLTYRMTLRLIRKKPPVWERSYISIAKQDCEGRLLEHKMATLEEMFDL